MGQGASRGLLRFRAPGDIEHEASEASRVRSQISAPQKPWAWALLPKFTLRLKATFSSSLSQVYLTWHVQLLSLQAKHTLNHSESPTPGRLQEKKANGMSLHASLGETGCFR